MGRRRAISTSERSGDGYVDVPAVVLIVFYTGKIAAAKFFAQSNLPKLKAERAILEATDLELMDLDESAF
ncbi:acyl-CoA dehydrogenase C-terminal domain-containing protein [Actinoplanes subglobosus]|uniref:Acyl-CoA dehydrogenase C-terminal domain-containing protein n=1 Tax=Actinoplanes subglobosus TaxID=1547892 RepID=A0ABV8IRD9_9ACTN